MFRAADDDPHAPPHWMTPFRQRWPFYGADAQTLCYDFMAKRHADLGQFRHERIEVDVGDGTGDRLAHEANVPKDPAGRACVVVHHGFGGTARSGYAELAAQTFLDAGHPVVRYNNRGCGIGRSLAKTAHWPGDSAAVRATVDHLADERPDLSRGGVFLLGFSLGCSAMIHYLAEEGQDARAFAAAAVSPPVDLVLTSKALSSPRTFPYRRFILPKVKHEIIRPSLDREVPATAVAAATVWQFDGAFNAPRFGHDTAEGFYRQFSLHEQLRAVKTPLLTLASRDDIFTPFAMHRAFDWSCNDKITAVHTDRGGHCGFHARDDVLPWCDRLALGFLRRNLPKRPAD